MKILLGIVLLIVVLIGCSWFRNPMRSSMRESDKKGRVIFHKMAAQFEEKYNLQLSAIREAGDKDHYTSMGMWFTIKQVLTKEEGRKLLINCVQEFLKELNENEDFQQHLSERPFTEKQVEIVIFTRKPDGKDVFYPDFRVFEARNGMMYYNTESPDKPFDYFSEEKETFKEALQIVSE